MTAAQLPNTTLFAFSYIAICVYQSSTRYVQASKHLAVKSLPGASHSVIEIRLANSTSTVTNVHSNFADCCSYVTLLHHGQ